MRRDQGGNRQAEDGQSPQEWNVVELVVQSGKDMFTDNALQWAAAVAYYTLLSVFPLLLAAVSIAGFFVDPDWAVARTTQFLGEFVPQGERWIEDMVRGLLAARGPATLLSLGALLWTGSRVFGSLTRALNIAFDVDETYSFGKRLLVELGFLLTLGLLFPLALSSGFLLNLAHQALGILPAGREQLMQVLSAAVPALLLLLTFFFVYRFVPRTRPDWKAALGGSAVATLLFLVARPLFAYYVQEFASYNLIYGSLSIVIILLVWTWLSAVIVLFGGEIASHIQMMWIEGKEPREVERRHEARSPERRVSDRARSAETGLGEAPPPSARRHTRQRPRISIAPRRRRRAG